MKDKGQTRPEHNKNERQHKLGKNKDKGQTRPEHNIYERQHKLLYKP